MEGDKLEEKVATESCVTEPEGGLDREGEEVSLTDSEKEGEGLSTGEAVLEEGGEGSGEGKGESLTEPVGVGEEGGDTPIMDGLGEGESLTDPVTEGE